MLCIATSQWFFFPLSWIRSLWYLLVLLHFRIIYFSTSFYVLLHTREYNIIIIEYIRRGIYVYISHCSPCDRSQNMRLTKWHCFCILDLSTSWKSVWIFRKLTIPTKAKPSGVFEMNFLIIQKQNVIGFKT